MYIKGMMMTSSGCMCEKGEDVDLAEWGEPAAEAYTSEPVETFGDILRESLKDQPTQEQAPIQNPAVLNDMEQYIAEAMANRLGIPVDMVDRKESFPAIGITVEDMTQVHWDVEQHFDIDDAADMMLGVYTVRDMAVAAYKVWEKDNG